MQVTLEKDMQGNPLYRVPDVNAWEDFVPFVPQLAQILKGSVIEKIDEVDIRIWEVLFDNVVIVFSIDDWEPLMIRAKEGKQHESEQMQKVIKFIRGI